jgi:hypothetical protein
VTLPKFPDLSDEKYLRMMKFYSYEKAKERIKKIVLDDKTKVRVVFMEDVQKWRRDMRANLGNFDFFKWYSKNQENMIKRYGSSALYPHEVLRYFVEKELLRALGAESHHKTE